MYERFYGLKDRPFSIAPDPRFLFMSHRHKEALAHLAYGIRHGAGFVLLTGEVGTGKTTICRQMLRKLPENTRLAFILNPMLDAVELLASLCDELGVDYNHDNYSLKQLTDNLTRFLLQCHQDNINVVLMIDEAQNLAPEVLEQIRLLTNLETDQRKLLQIILVGQPELQELLARKQLRQLAQRVTARYHLRPLDQQETRFYIEHRLRIAGTQNNVFTAQGIKAAYHYSDGIPRLINNLCDRAMMAAYSQDSKKVSDKHIKIAAEETMPLEASDKGAVGIAYWKVAAALMLVLVVGILIGQFTGGGNNVQKPSTTSSVQSPVVSESTTKNPAQVNTNPENKQTASQSSVVNLSDRNALFQHLLGQGRADDTGEFAQQVLSKRWQLDYQPERDGEFCRFVNDYRLQCVKGVESWQAIEELNRPVNLQLEDNNGNVSWLTLHRVEQDNVDIETVAGRRWVSQDWLLSLWNRQYQMIWQAPPGYSRPVRYGDRGDEVNWLAQRMAFLYSDDSLKSRQVFDAQMEQLLTDFQSRHGLKADGIAGINTLIQLNTSTIKNIPTLR